jgi:hypothetical protein
MQIFILDLLAGSIGSMMRQIFSAVIKICLTVFINMAQTYKNVVFITTRLQQNIDFLTNVDSVSIIKID